MTSAALAAAFLTGLLGSAHCIGMCGGFAACSTAGGRTLGALPYNAGRMTTYAVLGTLGGVLGGVLFQLQWVGTLVATVAVVLFAGRLAGLIPESKRRFRRLEVLAARAARTRGLPGPFLLGASTALLPCGLVYAALTMPVVTASPWAGALAMVLFGLGTAPALLAVAWGGARFRPQRLGTRRALAALILVLGLVAVFHRVPMGPPDEHVPDCCRTD